MHLQHQNKLKRGLFTSALFVLLIFVPLVSVGKFVYGQAGPSKVKIVQDENGFWHLKRSGKAFYVNGAGGTTNLAELASAGANTVRTWGVDEGTKKLLDQAHRHGLMVCLGIWIEHERHGFDYTDFDQVARQIDATIEAVNEFKDHPALLMWGIGNEMEGYQQGDNPAIWSHVEFLASKIKQIDPNHPTMTVIAEIGGRKVEALHKLCPSIDIVGINSYAGASTIPERYRSLKGTKPYIVTEFGPVGSWEVQKNSFGAVDEPTSTEKAKIYRKSYEALKADDRTCLGSFAFLWGNKQEATPTWFGMLLPDGKKTAAVDTMSELWTGKIPTNLCPEIATLKIEGPNTVQKSQLVKLELKASDPEGNDLNVNWVLTADSLDYATGGDFRESPKSLRDALVKADEHSATFKMPSEGGVYRIFAYVDDGEDAAAVANVPVFVEGDSSTPKPSNQIDLPYVVFDEPVSDQVYHPSGFMGEVDAIRVNQNCKENPKYGKSCIKCEYNKSDSWGGVVWQSPANDWGEKPGGLNLNGANQLSFWARGAEGGEKITFGFGILGRDKKFYDTAKKEMTFDLTDQWKEYTIKIGEKDMSRIKSAFYWSLAGQGKSIKFYLDNISFSKK